MNHQSEDPYYHESTSSSSTAPGGTYTVYTQKLSSDSNEEDNNPHSIDESDKLDDFMETYFDDSVTSDKSQSSSPNSKKMARAERDLEELMKETEGMEEIQEQLQMGRLDLGRALQEERTRQRRAAAARDRYQRMTEAERRLYNQRRRLRSLGVTSETSDDNEVIRNQVKTANAKKAEAARQRYHMMTPEQKKSYNTRRMEAFRKRREEEERIMSMPTGRIEKEDLAKASQIMVRNARKAEAARLRYQQMTPEERRAYNEKRARRPKISRKIPTKSVQTVAVNEMDEYGVALLKSLDGRNDDGEMKQFMEIDGGKYMEVDDEEIDDILHRSTLITGQRANLPLEILEVRANLVSNVQMAEVIDSVAASRRKDEIYVEMEDEVLRQTRKAHAVIMRNLGLTGPLPPNFPQLIQQFHGQPHASSDLRPDSSFSDYHDEPTSSSPIPEDTHNPEYTNHIPISPKHSPIPSIPAPEKEIGEPDVIDMQSVYNMVLNGFDAQGTPVEVRSQSGVLITSMEEFERFAHETIVITHRPEEKCITFDEMQQPTSLSSDMTQDNHVGSTTSTSSHPDMDYSDITIGSSEYGDYDEEDVEVDMVEFEEAPVQKGRRSQAVRARRAERARARYHRMSVEQRREQNARRAHALRVARAREDELLRLGETTPLDHLDEATQQAIFDAQQKRALKAEKARAKYRNMTEEERKRYNSGKEGNRNKRKRQEPEFHIEPEPVSEDVSVDVDLESASSPVHDPDDPSSFFFDPNEN
ncbi:hypothetical protein GCK72_011780 [Caenorhabditis remanei]|uniref:Uncharacterized protein n=1 Tax=Caenorhabditis remanei TaxID=31234 RepID=A0A6A5H9M0_CAERE|nr:hypothetical protein GCK72_011780 [Caenorhabditis remanei]KAF1763514.1 hypothetical protein GCK72_011780 [Caenorhabditis remanei]